MALTDKQSAFVEHYLTCFNATRAALLAGYSKATARQIGSENLTKKEIQDALKERLPKAGMQAEEIIVRLSNHARGDMSNFVREEEYEGTDGKKYKHVTPDLHAALEAGRLGLVKKFTLNKNGMSFEMYDSQSALVTLARIRGILETDKLPQGNEPAPVPDAATLARFAEFKRREIEQAEPTPAIPEGEYTVLPDDIAGDSA